MTFSVYTDADGYIGEVSAPTREAAAEFLAQQRYEPGTFELRELTDAGSVHHYVQHVLPFPFYGEQEELRRLMCGIE